MTVAAATLLLAGTALAQDFAPPKPGPEFDVLKKMEGTWQATVKMSAFGGQPASESKGTMTYKLECGGLWLGGNFSTEFGGQAFHGKGLDSYDAGKKKYVMVWVDSMSTLPMIGEGTYDKDTKTMTMTTDYPGPDGKMAKHKMVTVHKDDDTMDWTMSIVGKDGKDTVMMTIAYKRKK
jgi:hypothetical protein